MVENKSVRILSVDAKDLYNSNNLVNGNGMGYSTRFSDGTVSLKRYINAFDYSLDMIKLSEIYTKIARRKDWTFEVEGKRYSSYILNVTFKYTHKLYNKAGKNIYIKAGYLYRNLDFVDNICIIGGEVIGIKVDKPIKSNQLDSFQSKYFSYNAEKNVYERSGSIPTIKTKQQLREFLYKEGFMLDGAKYIRFKRSSGSSRVGKCWFINELLYSRFHQWQLCGLDIKDGDEIDLAAFESYISLTSSSIIDTMEILPENVLIIDDYESVFKDNVVSVGFEDGCLSARMGEAEIKNSIWDGQSLMDKSLFGKYSQYGMLLLRNRFFKTCAFNTNIQDWLADNDIYEVSQLNGFTLAKRVEDIKLITTPNSIKYLKFGNKQQWFDNWDNTFGIVKHEKPPHHFDGRMVQCHYQLLNTLQLSSEDMQRFLQPSLDYITKVKDDPDVLRYHIKHPHSNIEDYEFSSESDVVFALMGVNDDFTKTKLYQDFRNDLVKSMIKNLKRGHVLINGNYSVMFGNGLEMLKQSIGQFNGESEIGVGNVISKRFSVGKKLLGTRSPHITMANIYLAENISHAGFYRYFNLSNEIVCVNAICENLQQKLNGADYDSDTLLITDDKTLIDNAITNYNRYLVPTNCVAAEKAKRRYSDYEKADLDVKTSVNKIGEIVNLSQELNSKFWHNIHDGQSFEQNSDLYSDICKLSVLSGIEIDKAKKEFSIDSMKELKFLKEKWKWKGRDDKSKAPMIIKPMFFKMITKENGYELNPKHRYKYFHTSMDYLQKIINRYVYNNRKEVKETYLPFCSIIKTVERVEFNGKYYKTFNRIIDEIRLSNKKIKEAYCRLSSCDKHEHKCVFKDIDEMKSACKNYISSLRIGRRVAYLLVKAFENKDYSDVHRLIFQTVFQKSDDVFIDLINENNTNISKLTECDDGDITLYDFKFRREGLES